MPSDIFDCHGHLRGKNLLASYSAHSAPIKESLSPLLKLSSPDSRQETDRQYSRIRLFQQLFQNILSGFPTWMSRLSLTFSHSVWFLLDTAGQESTTAKEAQCPGELALGHHSGNRAGKSESQDEGLTCEMILNMMDK